jgi:hypothetical protein
MSDVVGLMEAASLEKGLSACLISERQESYLFEPPCLREIAAINISGSVGER